MEKDKIIEIIQENYNDKEPDEKEKQDILLMSRTFSITTLVVIVITIIVDILLKNYKGIFEIFGIELIICGFAYKSFDKNSKLIYRIRDYLMIGLGIFMYMGFIALQIGK